MYIHTHTHTNIHTYIHTYALLRLPLCAYTGSEHAVFEEIMAYVAENAHRVHLNELVTHVRAALSERLQICIRPDQVRNHFLAHQ